MVNMVEPTADDVRKMCERLSDENIRYALAVINALVFAQAEAEKREG